MRIYQILPVFAYGDAIGNDTIALNYILEDAGYETHIYARAIDGPVPKGISSSIDELKYVEPEDVILYHLSTGSDLNYRVAEYNCHLVIIYHNITPEHFFATYSKQAYESCRKGLRGARFLADKAEYVIADSEYNRQDLIHMGYTCTIDVLPILIAFSDYEKTPNQNIIDQYRDGKTNIIFTGRIAPNKKQEDVIAAFAEYKKKYDSEARLFLVGRYDDEPVSNYYAKLKQYIEENHIQDIIFTGHIAFQDILAYYRIADLFLCMSEHEGFCVPLVEAMYFNVPIVAYDSTAIGDTLGGSGILLQDKDPIVVAVAMNKVLLNPELKQLILNKQQSRLQAFAHERIGEHFLRILKQFLDNKDLYLSE